MKKKTKLNEKELREEYILELKTDRADVIVGVGIFGLIVYMILSFSPSWWKLFVIIPLILIIFGIKIIKEIGKRIKENET